jgi:tRNA (cmo5U34)-methyltransferase
LAMELCTDAAKYNNPAAINLLDVGCGAGNYTLKMLSKIPDLNCTLVDLSEPMLQRARQRVSTETKGMVTTIQADIRFADLPENHFDIILAAAVFHHLREDEDWRTVFAKMHRLLKPGGSLWISDLVTHDTPAIATLFEQRYGDYIESIGGKEYREKVLAYVNYEDTPRSVFYQLSLLKEVGFKQVDILHKNSSFAAFGGVK